MLEKTSGRGGWLTTAEAARLIGVNSAQIHHMTRGRLLDAHYPEGRRAGKRFLEEDVLALRDLRREGGSRARLERLALRAVLASRRAERRVEEMTHYLGLDAPGLPLEPEAIAALHHRIDEWLLHKELEGQVLGARAVAGTEHDQWSIAQRPPSALAVERRGYRRDFAGEPLNGQGQERGRSVTQRLRP
ncbi:MAG TPA: hypothetical protein VFS00_08890, partial [Polyangiaceae bacterium]|nr:hypothetical protein [Polyangiaceae bacterium]